MLALDGAYHRQGYGQFFIYPDVILAHRASVYLHTGRMPAREECVCHKCDVTSCVNPDHLWLGSYGDNVRDAFSKGRMRRNGSPGESNSQAILTIEQVIVIRTRCRKPKEFADQYGVSVSTVYAVLSGANWQ